MASKKTGTVIVKAQSGHVGKMVLPGATSLAAVAAFITSVESAFMTGKAVSRSWSETEKIEAEIIGGNTDRRGIIVYNDNNAQITKRFSVPSWGDDPGDRTMETDGERIPLVACQSVIEALETATGGNLTALEGWIIQGK